ncbi:WD40 repeat domain-containing serine/threonine protein kinase [Frankia sp. CcWB3]
MFLARNGEARPVLVKTITAPFGRDTEFRRRLRVDLDNIRRLAPSCLAAILDLDTGARPPYVVAEFIDAPTLAATVADGGALSGPDTHRLAVGLATALAALHESEIFLGDLKPINVVLSERRLRLIDFGLFRAMNAVSMNNPGGPPSGIGTLAFITPEQVLGQTATVASDVFTWGSVLLFAVTGRPPFGAGTPRVLLQRAVYAEPDLSVFSPELRELVAAAMRKDPKRRPAAAELLEQLVAHPTRSSEAEPAVEPTRRLALPAGVIETPVPVQTRRAAESESKPEVVGTSDLAARAIGAIHGLEIVLEAATETEAVLETRAVRGAGPAAEITAVPPAAAVALSAVRTGAEPRMRPSSPGPSASVAGAPAPQPTAAASARASHVQEKTGNVSALSSSSSPGDHLDRGWLRRVLSIGVAASVLVLPTVVIVDTLRERSAAATSREAARGAMRLLDREPDLAGQLAVSAYRTAPTSAAAEALVNASVRQIGPATGAIRDLLITPDGRYLIIIGDFGGSVWSIIGPGRVRHVTDLPAVAAATGDRSPLAAGIAPAAMVKGLLAVALVPASGPAMGVRASTTMVTAGTDRVIRLWRLAQPGLTDDGDLQSAIKIGQRVSLLAELRGHTGTVASVAVSADGRTLASAGADRVVRLWDISHPQNPRALAELPQPAEVTSLAFTPDGDSLAVGGAGHLSVWDVTAAGQPRRRAHLTAAATVRKLLASPDGRWLAVASTSDGGSLTEIYGLDSPRGLHRLTAIASRPGQAGSIALSADGRVLAVSTPAGQVTLWDMRSPSRPVQPATLPVGTAPTATVFGPLGHEGVLVGVAGDAVRLWQLDLLAAEDEICARAEGRINREQWRTYLGHRRYDPPCD